MTNYYTRLTQAYEKQCAEKVSVHLLVCWLILMTRLILNTLPFSKKFHFMSHSWRAYKKNTLTTKPTKKASIQA